MPCLRWVSPQAQQQTACLPALPLQRRECTRGGPSCSGSTYPRATPRTHPPSTASPRSAVYFFFLLRSALCVSLSACAHIRQPPGRTLHCRLPAAPHAAAGVHCRCCGCCRSPPLQVFHPSIDPEGHTDLPFLRESWDPEVRSAWPANLSCRPVLIRISSSLYVLGPSRG